MLDAAELRRASATDAGAVAQYLSSIDNDELDALLDAFADAERKKKDDGDALEWRALVHVLLRTQSTRQRTATRILQSLWRGHASEMEALRWVSEISLAYMASLDSEHDVAVELRVVLQIAFQFVRDAMGAAKHKTLPQLLALVPVLLHLLGEATSRTNTVAMEGMNHDDSASLLIVHEHVIQLLELPWDVRSIPHLLELLREHTTLVSRSGWTQLRQSVDQLITPPAASELPTECLNPLIRECLLLTASCGDAADETAAWIAMARSLLRRLPGHMRQEAEFNMQMSLHQYPSLASVICDVLSASTTPSLALDASDAVLLLHAIRASKPLLHHHLVGSALAVTSSDRTSVLSKAQQLIFSVLDPVAATTDKSLRQAVTSMLEFGGRQFHVRVWKAQLLHELARLWSHTQPSTTAIQPNSQAAEGADMGVLVTESVFITVREVREDILQGLLESSRVAAQSERALHQLGRLVRHQPKLLVPYRQRLEDWLSALASLSQHAAKLTAAFATVMPLVASLKDFYNFTMVLLRKQLSSPHASDRQLAMNVWCSWFEDTGLALDANQQEEVVLAIKHAVQLSHDREWTYRRLAHMFQSSIGVGRPHRLDEASLIEFHRLFASSLRAFVEPIETKVVDHESEGDSEEDTEDDASALTRRRRRLRRFTVSTLDAQCAQNSSISAALHLGPLLESLVDCLVGVEHAMAASSRPTEAPLGSDLLRWLDVFIRHREKFFQWVSGGDAQCRVGDSRFAWALAARVSLGSAFCNLALRSYVVESSRRIHPRVWALLEAQLSLARLWRKFSATTPMADAALLPKDQQLDAKILHSAAATLRLSAASLLRGVVAILQSSSGDSGASLDGILFLLDAYTQSLASPDSPPPSSSHVSGEMQALISIYTTVASTVASPAASVDGSMVISPIATARFTTYGESLAAQFPASIRHLVVPDSVTSLTVTLDARAVDEVLSRVCGAISKVATNLAHRRQLTAVHGTLSALAAPLWSGDAPPCVVSLGHIAARLLEDVKCVLDRDGYAKFRLAGVALVRKLVDLPSDQTSDEPSLDAVADAAYDLLCDHVVHQPPLLRGLLALSFPSASLVTDRVGVIIDRAGAVLAACGFGDHIDKPLVVTTPTDVDDITRRKSKRPTEMKTQPVRRRRRLRQISEDEEEAESFTSDNGVTHTEDRDDLALRNADVSFSTSTDHEHQRQPRLTTAAAQRAALAAAMTLLESLHARTLPLLTALARVRASPDAVASTPLTSLSHAARIHTLLVSSVFASSDMSWINARTLAKLTSVVEAAVRVGKHCGVLAGRRTYPDGGECPKGFVQGFKSSVAVTMRGRAWLALLRDAAIQPSAKSKLSATILKLDVFLLEVPTLVASLMKAETVPFESKRDLRVFLSTVEADLAFSTSMATSRSVADSTTKRSSTKRHLVGIVPIVHTKRRKRLRSRHAFIDSCLAEEDGDDAFADLEDFIA